jgi:hypothetical protein
MPDHWGYVAAAYAVAVLVFGGYWRRLVRRERELTALVGGVRNDRANRSRQPSRPAHPRPDPASRAPLP